MAKRSASSAKTSTRQWWALAALCLLAFGVGALMRQAGPVGTDIGGRIDLAPLLGDRASPSSGPADAPVTLVVFTDYQCPACRAAHPAMLRAGQSAGDVRIVYRDLPVLGPVSEQAARVALATRGQGLYAQVHDAFMREPRWLTPAVMREIVTGLGGDWSEVEDALDGDREIGRQLARNRTDALRLGVEGTPAYLIGSYRIIGALDEGGFAKAFEQARRAGG